MPFSFVLSPSPALDLLPSTLINVDYVLPPLIFDDRSEFCAPAFRIKYCDEEVLSRSIARFRVELLLERTANPDGNYALICEPVTISVRLYHARSSTQFDRDGDIEAQILKSFTLVAVQVDLHHSTIL